MTQNPEPATDSRAQPVHAASEPVVPGAFLDDDVLEEMRLADIAERQRLERRIARHDVTTILVSHDGARWLPYSLTALADLTHPPHRVVAVDTGSADASRRFLVESLTEAGVLDRPRTLSFGRAVDDAVSAYVGAPGLPTPDVEAPRVQWLWLLHDDSAPEADALRQLLLAAERNPQAGVIGPKVRGWRDGRLLLELGVTVGRGGRRETWLERDETDQGQHDHRREVLAVGSAGMLVRRDVWDELGGFDPAFSMFREDVDLCWRAWRAGHEVVVAPDAVVHHVEAAAHGRRRTDAAIGGRAHRSDRTSALFLLLANLPIWSLPWTYLRLLVGSLLRAAGLAVAKAPAEVVDELVALAAVLGRPDRIVRARARRRATAVRPWSDVRPLLAPTGIHLRQALEALVGLLSVGSAVRSVGGSALESGPTDGDNPDLMPTGPSLLRRTFARPGTWLGVALIVLAVAADRHLFGRGALEGGALLPAPARAGDLWSRYSEAWHAVGVGSSVTAPPSLAVLALPSWLALGHVGLVVTILFLLAVPLAGISAYVLAGRLTRRRGVRIWAALTYALLPSITGAVAAGRIGTAILGWLLPLIVLTVLRALRRGSRWPVTWGAVLLLTAGVAFVPVLWLAAALLAVAVLAVGAARRGIGSLWRGRGATARLLVLVIAPPLLLLPWSVGLMQHPSRIFLEAGAPAPSTVDPNLPSWALALAQPGGPVPGSRWLLVGLVIAALASLLRPDRRRPVVLGWALALVGLGLAVTALVIRVPSTSGGPAIPWPGAATLFVGGGLVAAATVGGDGLRDRLASRTFGWRQPLTLIIAVLAVLGTVGAGVAWVARGADHPLARSKGPLLPPYIAAASGGPLHPRSLVLSADGMGRVTYALQRGAGPVFGDAELAPVRGKDGGLADVVSGLTAGVEDDGGAQRLAAYGVGSVVALRPLPAAMVTALDATPGLERLSSTKTTEEWRVGGTPGRARLLTPGSGTRSLTLTTSTSSRLTSDLAQGPAGRRLVLAEAADPRWHATLAGIAATATTDGWAQAFTLPAGRGELVVTYDGSAHRRALTLQGVLVLLAVLLALPARRRREELDDDLPPEPLHGKHPASPAEVAA